MAEPADDRRTEAALGWPILLVLPAAYLVSALVLRTDGGPFWIFHAIDPSYFYLFNSLNLVNLTTPGNVAHPGTPVQVLGALVLWIRHGFAGAEAIIPAVLADAETQLRAISTVIYALNALALVAAGIAARAALSGLLPALIVQSAPFLSMVVVRHGLYVKPESLLVLATLALATVTLLALRPGEIDRRPMRYAVLFGVVAGFGLSVKVSAAPVYVLPVFLLWGLRPLAAYAGVSVLAFVAFTLPAAGAYGEFFGWIGQVAMGTGHFGGGAATVIDPAAYPRQVLRMFSRPILFVPVILAGLVFLTAWRRRRGGHSIPRPELRALGGTALAQCLNVLVTAKHPDAHYLVPSFLLSGLTLALVYAAVAGLGVGTVRWRRLTARTTAVLFGILLVAQAGAVVRQDIELRFWRSESARVDNAKFRQCARVYFQFASDPAYALLLADHITRGKLTVPVAPLVPAGVFWFDVVSGTFRDAHGPRDMLEVLAAYPCAFFRGQDRSIMAAYLEREAPGFIVHDRCSTRFEGVFTAAVDCAGALTGK